MVEFSPKAPYGSILKTPSSPPRRTLTANFTSQLKLFDITQLKKDHSLKHSMRQNILEEVMKKTESVMDGSENQVYEDPRDVIDKPSKPPRKRNIHAIAISSPRQSKEQKSLLRDQKRKLTKKYENLINTLMDRCEENIIALSEKDNLISKLKEKLRSVLEYNHLFAEENDTMRTQYEALAKYVEECKAVIREEREKNRELERKKRELEQRVATFEVPDRDYSAQQAIPLVEVCMSCSSRQIVLSQAREHSLRLQKDMQAMKDVLYRLNVQLSRYQEKLRSVQHMADRKGDGFKPGDRTDGLDSLINASLGIKATETASTEEKNTKSFDIHPSSARLVDLSGLLSAQALAPLFDAYQENLQEKDTLIADYEKQFEIINKKSKQIVTDNKTLSERVNALEEELLRVRQSYKRTTVEKETADIEKATLVERAERAEIKLKEVYELYEDKMAAMMRDYETVHREYFSVKNALEASEGKMAQLDILRARTVPADLHERRLDHCKRLLEELKHQYGMEAERKTEQLAKLQELMKGLEEKHSRVCRELDSAKQELEQALKNVRLYRKAAVIFRQRVKAVRARAARARSEPLRRALHALEQIKNQIKVVKSRAYASLAELERRIVEQERRAAHAHASARRGAERARVALEHKENIIRSLIDKVADVEEVRLSQTNTHRLQGILDTSPELSPSDPEVEASKPEDTPARRQDETRNVKLIPGDGGYFQEKEGRKKSTG